MYHYFLSRAILLVSGFLISLFAYSQTSLLNSDYDALLVPEFLEKLNRESELTIHYNRKDIPDIRFYGIDNQTHLSSYLKAELEPTGLVLLRMDATSYLLIRRELYQEFGAKSSNYRTFTSTIKQEKYRLTGKITDRVTGEPLLGVQVINTSDQTGSLTDLNGDYQFAVSQGIKRLEIRYMGYEIMAYVVVMKGDGVLDATLRESTLELNELVIVAQDQGDNVQSSIAGTQIMSVEAIKSIPAFMGEVDHLKSLAALPGVRTGELASGINVRGGETGQNLILQDGALIVNPSHMFGFFSAFNPDMVNQVALHKGGGGAENGGRVSSILEAGLKNGNLSQLKVQGGIGFTSSRATVELPLVRNKWSIISGGRYAYPNWLIGRSNDLMIKNNQAGFYDLTTKIFGRINDRNMVTLSHYLSNDNFLFAADSVSNDWRSHNFSFNWTHQLNDGRSLKTTLAKSDYTSQVVGNGPGGRFKSTTGLENYRFKLTGYQDFSNGNSLQIGLESNHYITRLGDLESLSSGPEGNLPQKEHEGTEMAVFGQWTIPVAAKLSLAAGFRFSGFVRWGNGTEYTYDYSQREGFLPAISDSTSYSSGSLQQAQFSPEPRLSLRYLLSATSSLKLSVYQTAQYLHLISNSASATPQDYYVMSGPLLAPQRVTQYSAGWFKNLHDNGFELSMEYFYKHMANSIDFIDGADITQNERVEQGLMQDLGKAYGVEAMVKKNSGKWNGWIAYTYSRSLRRLRGEGDIPPVNNGNLYPAAFDQPHDLTVISNNQVNDRVTLSVNFNYSTGRPLTIPTSAYNSAGVLNVNYYSDRNQYRMPDYHRLDLSLKIRDKQIRNKRIEGEWNFSIYNLYGRKNAYSVYFDQYGVGRKMFVIGQVFPSASYQFSF